MLLLLCTLICLVRDVKAESIGFERFTDEYVDVCINYFPVVPYDTRYPTASEQFAFTFSALQNSFWTNLITKYIGTGLQITVLVLDEMDTRESEYLTFHQWFPVSTAEYGIKLQWSLDLATRILGLGITVDFTPIAYTRADYSAERRGEWWYLSNLYIKFTDWLNWGYDGRFTTGGGTIGVKNGKAVYHTGHPIQMYFHFCMSWIKAFGVGPEVLVKFVDFIIGDNTPITDCYIRVAPGTTQLTITTPEPSSPGSGGGGLSRMK